MTRLIAAPEPAITIPQPASPATSSRAKSTTGSSLPAATRIGLSRSRATRPSQTSRLQRATLISPTSCVSAMRRLAASGVLISAQWPRCIPAASLTECAAATGIAGWASSFAVFTFVGGPTSTATLAFIDLTARFRLLWREMVHVVSEEHGLVSFRGELIHVGRTIH